jgi:hypothetical protein
LLLSWFGVLLKEREDAIFFDLASQNLIIPYICFVLELRELSVAEQSCSSVGTELCADKTQKTISSNFV